MTSEPLRRPAAAGTAEANRPRLYTAPFVILCALGFLGFAAQFVIQPVLPLLIVDLGGDATLVGITIAVFSIPSVLARPFMGRAVDELSNRLVLAAGTAGIALTGFAYLIPSLPAILVNRVVHGTAWSAFNTGANAMLARLAPQERRGEATGVFNLMPAIAQMVMPGLGLLLLGRGDFALPFLVAAACGVGATFLVLAGNLPWPSPRRDAVHDSFWHSLVEPGAVLPMTLEFFFSSVFSLFLIFPPLWAADHGIDPQALTPYVLLYGLALVGVRFLARGAQDRFDRRLVIAVGALLAIASLALTALATDVPSLTIAGSLYGAAAGIASPAAMALAMDRSNPARMGAAMATYSLGFQFAIGAGAALWGVIIDAAGFPAPYVVGIGAQLVVLALVALSHR